MRYILSYLTCKGILLLILTFMSSFFQEKC